MLENLSPSLLELIMVILLVVLSFIVSFAGVAFSRSEGVRRLGRAWKLIDDAIIDLVVFIVTNEPDLDDYVDAANEAELDVRLYFLVQQIEARAATYLGFTPDLIELHARAERIYQELREDDGMEVVV